MNYFSFICLFIFIVIIGGCDSLTKNKSTSNSSTKFIINSNTRNWQKDNTSTITLEKIKQFDFSNNVDIASILFLRVNDKGDIFFIDIRKSRIVSLNPDGNLKKIHGESGRGPGDLYKPTDLLVTDKYIYIANIEGTIIDQYDQNLNYLKSIRLPNEMSRITFGGIISNSNLIVLSTIPDKIGGRITIIDPSRQSKVDNYFDATESEVDGLEMLKPAGEASTLWNMIAYTHDVSYEIDFFDLDGKLIFKTKRELDSIFGPAVSFLNGGLTLFTLGSISEPYQFNNNYFLVDVRYPTNIKDRAKFANGVLKGQSKTPNFKHSLDVYTKNGKLVFVFEDDTFFDSYGKLSAVKNEILYFVEANNRLSISKFEMKFHNDW